MLADQLVRPLATNPLYQHATFATGQPVRYSPPFADMRYAGQDGVIVTITGHSATVLLACGDTATVDQRNLTAL